MGAPVSESPEEANLAQFIAFVDRDVQDSTWTRLLPGYRRATVVYYRQGTNAGCGYGQAAAGPFYCPADETVYLDLSFFGEMKSRLGADGDFAQAYVIAHEIAHHVQHQTGIAGDMRNSRGNENAKSVQLKLQADCLAGVWATRRRSGTSSRPGTSKRIARGVRDWRRRPAAPEHGSGAAGILHARLGGSATGGAAAGAVER